MSRQVLLGKTVKRERVSYSLPVSLIEKIESIAKARGVKISTVAEYLILDALESWGAYNAKVEKARGTVKKKPASPNREAG